MKRFLSISVIIILTIFQSAFLFAQDDPIIGTWKLNTAESKYNFGTEPHPLLPYRSRTITYQAAGDGLKFNSDGIAADGSHRMWSYAAAYDGKDNPISGNVSFAQDSDTISMQRINPNTSTATFKKAGKTVRTTQRVVSADGKMLTMTATDNGKVVDVLVFDRQ